MSTAITEVQTAVTEFDKVAAGLAALKEQFGGVVFEVTTGEGMGAAKEARAAVREPRYAVEHARKAGKSKILKLGKELDDLAERLTTEILAIEGPIDEQIKNEEARKEREKQAKIDAELKRVTDLQGRVAYLRGSQNISSLSPPELIAEHISDLESEAVDASMQEYEQQALEAKASGLSRLRDMHAAAVARVAEQERIKAERAELESLRAAQAKRDAEDRARIAEEEKTAKAARDKELVEQRREQARIDAELKAQRDQEDKERRERQAVIDAENTRIAEANAAEANRLRVEREENEARKEEAFKAQQDQARLASIQKPKDSALISILASHYNVPAVKVVEWILAMDFSKFADEEAA